MDFKIRKPFNENYPISQGFGSALDWYVKIVGYPHNGVDYAMPTGTPVYAVDDGTVVYADNVPDANGCGINILHGWGLSQYWHLSMLSARYREKVVKGQLLGYSGATGWATGPHLHFGIKVPSESPANMRGWANPIPHMENAENSPSVPPATSRMYIVKYGDTLWSIAQKFYGKGYLWTVIYSANKDKINNPNVIKPLQILKVPTL